MSTKLSQSNRVAEHLELDPPTDKGRGLDQGLARDQAIRQKFVDRIESLERTGEYQRALRRNYWSWLSTAWAETNPLTTLFAAPVALLFVVGGAAIVAIGLWMLAAGTVGALAPVLLGSVTLRMTVHWSLSVLGGLGKVLSVLLASLAFPAAAACTWVVEAFARAKAQWIRSRWGLD